jgi:hypothetical protein
MDSIDFTLATGFPLDEAQLDFLQQAYTKSFLGLGKFIGGSDPDTVYILQGCDNFAGITNNGFIVLAGEILPFIGGPTLPNIIITEESLAGLVYQDGVTRFPRHRRFASFGTTPTHGQK